MQIIRWSVCIILTFFWIHDVKSQDDFPWEMFLPGISNPCKPNNLISCTNQTSCELQGGFWYENSCHSDPEPTCTLNTPDLCISEQDCLSIQGYWYDDSCHVEPQELVCDTDHHKLCLTEEECVHIDGYWYELSCHARQSLSLLNTSKLTGSWNFVMQYGFGTFNQQYFMDSSTIRENPIGSGIFTIEGYDRINDPAIGNYVPENDTYTMYVEKTNYDIFYEFIFTSSNEISGCYFQVDKSDGSLGGCIKMTGTKL